MKKLVLSAAAIACLTMVSCKKDYTCECSGTFTQTYDDADNAIFNYSASVGGSESYKLKESDAKERCSSNEEDTNASGSDSFGTYKETTKITCDLKKK